MCFFYCSFSSFHIFSFWFAVGYVRCERNWLAVCIKAQEVCLLPARIAKRPCQRRSRVEWKLGVLWIAEFAAKLLFFSLNFLCFENSEKTFQTEATAPRPCTTTRRPVLTQVPSGRILGETKLVKPWGEQWTNRVNKGLIQLKTCKCCAPQAPHRILCAVKEQPAFGEPAPECVLGWVWKSWKHPPNPLPSFPAVSATKSFLSMPFHAFPIPEVFFPDCQMQLILLFWGLRSVIQGQPQWQRPGRKTKLLPLEASRLHGHIAWPDWKWLRMIEWWSKMQQNASSKKDAKGGQRGKDSKRFEKPPAIFTGFQTTSRRVVFLAWLSLTNARSSYLSFVSETFRVHMSFVVVCRRLSSPGCVLRLRYNITTGDFRPKSIANKEGPATSESGPELRVLACCEHVWTMIRYVMIRCCCQDDSRNLKKRSNEVNEVLCVCIEVRCGRWLFPCGQGPMSKHHVFPCVSMSSVYGVCRVSGSFWHPVTVGCWMGRDENIWCPGHEWS